MERRSCPVRTPLNSLHVQRYRQSYRSYVGTASHLGYTPGLSKRRLTTSRISPKCHSITDKVDPAQLALLMKREWQLSYVTPLYQFQHDQLKRYTRQLSAFIVSEQQQGLAVEVGLESNLKVSFTVVQGMAETEDDADTIFIQIHSKNLFAAQDEPLKVFWSGWFTCIRGNQDYLRSLPKDFVCLPLFCSDGGERLTALVKAWFERTFDCRFGPLEITSTNLQWLAALWTDCHPESNIQHLMLLWTLPAVPPLEVSYSLHPQDAWELWRSERQQGREEEGEDEDGSVGIEEVTRFIKGLKRHFFRHFRLDLSAGWLTKVSTALGSAKHSGKLKISNSSYMLTTLMLLTECALLKMPV